MDRGSRHSKYINFLAGIAANQEAVSKCRIAAMLVQSNNVPVAVGANKMKTHPLQARFGKNEHAIYLHAEIDAIAKALKTLDTQELSKCVLYVCRTLQDGSFGLAKPCPGCQSAIRAFGIQTVVWTTEDGYAVSKGEELNESIDTYNQRVKSNQR
jgi:tRNA(Arg) A34 adenosine deaminase TadA